MNQLVLLNSLVWTAVVAEALTWAHLAHQSAHQLWAVVIPPEEVSLTSRMLSFLHSN